MRHQTLNCLFIAVAIIFFVSCKKNETSQIIITKKPVSSEPKQTQRIGDYEQTMDIEWGGAMYGIYVSRQADESLPLTDDGLGNKYYDNKINVKITRSDGSVFFNNVFTKADFSQYLDASSKKNDAILGVVFDKVEDNSLLFAASIGSPDIVGSDEYIPFVVKVSRNGSVSIAKDTQRDINGDSQGGVSDSDIDEGV